MITKNSEITRFVMKTELQLKRQIKIKSKEK